MQPDQMWKGTLDLNFMKTRVKFLTKLKVFSFICLNCQTKSLENETQPKISI